jgi:deoxycytidylate deaminase
MLINCGVKRIVSAGDYPDSLAKEMLAAAGVEVVLMEEEA